MATPVSTAITPRRGAANNGASTGGGVRSAASASGASSSRVARSVCGAKRSAMDDALCDDAVFDGAARDDAVFSSIGASFGPTGNSALRRSAKPGGLASGLRSGSGSFRLPTVLSSGSNMAPSSPRNTQQRRRSVLFLRLAPLQEGTEKFHPFRLRHLRGAGIRLRQKCLEALLRLSVSRDRGLRLIDPTLRQR